MKALFVSSGNLTTEISPIVENQAESLIQKGIEIDHFTIKGKGLLGYLKNIPALRKQLKSQNYSIIHAHFGYCAIVSQLAKIDQPLVSSFMGDDLLLTKKEDGSATLPSKIMTAINQWFGVNRYNFIIVKTEEMKKKLPCEHVTVIPNGVNLERFKPEDQILCRKNLGLDLDQKIILFATDPKRMEKNYLLAKKAHEHLNKTTSSELLVVYDIDQAKLCQYYNASDVVILTSFHEGSPNVIKETMACNIPIVSTPVGDVKELIGNTEGCFISSYDPDQFAHKIQQALDFGKRTDGRNNIKHLESGIIADKVITVYKNLLGN